MVVRPLDLASRLRPPPRDWDWVFYVNLGLLVLFFTVFGSRFVLSPAIIAKDGDLQLATVESPALSLTTSTAVVSIKANGQIFTPDLGRISLVQLKIWLAQKAAESPKASLLMVADANVSYSELSRIYAAAAASGFATVALAAEPAAVEEAVP